MVKILAIGHSIVMGDEDNIDSPYRADSSTAPHIPEGGWRYQNFQIAPRWG